MMAGFYGDVAPTALETAAYPACKKLRCAQRPALTGQIRRSSRSVCNNLREAWAKRRYEAHFLSKVTGCGAALSSPQATCFAPFRGCIFGGAALAVVEMV